METIGFIGLGLMGKPMARNLMRSGYPLVVFNRSHAPMLELELEGAHSAHNPREVAQTSDLVITMLPNPQTVEQVIAGDKGVLEGSRAGMIVVDMSTSHPRLARRLAELGQARQVSVIDAPVSGGQVGAQQATLSIMVGAGVQSYERVLPILKQLGSNIVRVGEAGTGQVVKAANQVIVALTIEAIAEGLVMAAKAGADPARAREVMMGGFASSRILELHGQRMIERTFEAGARLTTQHKDLQIALEIAEEYGVEMPVTGLVDELVVEVIQKGLGDQDHSALVQAIEARAGFALGS